MPNSVGRHCPLLQSTVGSLARNGTSMGYCSRVIFPRFCDCLMGQPFLVEQRKEILANVAGDILEIGFGTGLNLPHYPEHVRRITKVDPNPGMNNLARRRIAADGIEVDQRGSAARRCRLPWWPSTVW
jgi:hypothetical protein